MCCGNTFDEIVFPQKTAHKNIKLYCDLITENSAIFCVIEQSDIHWHLLLLQGTNKRGNFASEKIKILLIECVTENSVRLPGIRV